MTISKAGDGDGTVNPGETIELWVTLENIGTEAATGDWLLFADRGGDQGSVAGALSAAITARGGRTLLVAHGTALELPEDLGTADRDAGPITVPLVLAFD